MLTGHVTPLAMYRLLHDAKEPDCVLMIDESFLVLNHVEIQQMLRSALYSRKVDWYSHGRIFEETGLPESFSFQGRIIFNLNEAKTSDFNRRALLDRVLYNKVLVTGEQVASKMRGRATYKCNRKLWKLIEDRLILIRERQADSDLTDGEKDQVLNFTTDKILQISSTYSPDVSMRGLERSELVFQFFKGLFGVFDFDFSSPFAERYLMPVGGRNLLLRIIHEKGGEIAIGDAARTLSDFERISRRTAYRRIREAVDEKRVGGNNRKLWLITHKVDGNGAK